jgi:hypothetical protein
MELSFGKNLVGFKREMLRGTQHDNTWSFHRFLASEPVNGRI